MNSVSAEQASRLAELKDCVVEAAKTVCRVTCLADLQVKDDDQKGADGAVLAVFSLTGDLAWTVYLGLPRATVPSIAEAFAGYPVAFDSPDMGDAISELANVFAAETKASLARRDVHVATSLPGVLRTEGLEILVQHNASAVKMYYASPFGPLWTAVAAGRGEGFVA